MKKVEISTEFIKLDSAMKLSGAAAMGSDAKRLVQSGVVAVNGETEPRRGRKLYPGDVFSLDGEDYMIEKS